MGSMGMGYREMECMTYYDVCLKVKGFQQQLAVQENWARNIAYSAYSPHLGKKAKTLTLEKFWPVPELDDRRKKIQKLTPERQQRVGDTIKELMRKTNGKTRDDT